MGGFGIGRLDESRVLNPGVLRHQIQWLREVVTGQDSYGQDITGPSVILTCKAQVQGLIGRELFAAQQRWAEVRYKIRQHYSPGLMQSDTIQWFVDGVVRTLDVVDIGDPGGNGRVQTIYAKDHV